jgi:hypothetical protein
MPSIAFATNGYFSHGFGTKSKGLAGAAVALPQDAMVAATNPAGMVHVGSRWDVGLAAFNPNRGYTANDDAQPGSAPFLLVSLKAAMISFSSLTLASIGCSMMSALWAFL